MKHYEYIRINYNHLLNGDSDTGNRTERCYRSDELGDSPSSCDLTVENEDGVLKYHCFSASCPCSGRVEVSRKGQVQQQRGNVPVRNKRGIHERADSTLSHLVQTLPRPCIEYLESNNVTPRDAIRNGLRYDPVGGRLVFPVQIDGLPRGYIYRSVGTGDASKLPSKWLRQKGFKGAIIPFKGNGTTVYFVEALTSALHMKQITDSPVLAMLSIMFDEGKRSNTRKWLKTQGITSIVILPDPDVSQRMCIKLKKELTLDGFKVSVKRVKQKPRYCSKEELLNE